MTDAQRRFHEEWLGLVQPIEGLVFSVPVLADAQIMPRSTAELTAQLRETVTGADDDPHIADTRKFLAEFLGYAGAGNLVARDELPEDLHFYAEEGRQDIRPSLAIAHNMQADSRDDPLAGFGEPPGGSSDTSGVAEPWIALVWDVRDDAGTDVLGLSLDKPEEATGPWKYPPTAKFERLLRRTEIPIGLLTNGRHIRIVYAPSGESTSHLTFRLEDMVTPAGRPVLAAFELLLNARRSYQAASEHTLSGLLAESRRRQADVTKGLAEQVFEAVEVLLEGFEHASGRDDAPWLEAALEAENDHLYQGVLSIVLRLVFLLYAEDQGLLPVTNPFFAKHLSVQALYDDLVEDAGMHPESMNHRFGAYGRLLALFRAVFLGVKHDDLELPPRHGRLFDPSTFPFLEGGLPGDTAAIVTPEARSEVRPPLVDDAAIHAVLQRLVLFEGQRLSYRALGVEQIGSVYESLMGYNVLRTASPAVRLGKNRVWVEAVQLRDRKPTDRKKWLKEACGLTPAQQKKVEQALKEYTDDARVCETLVELAPGRATESHRHRAPADRLLLQPGDERRRSGSHYTPRILTEKIVRRTLEPLLSCLGDTPTEEQVLSLKICDPAMGSGAFLVETCRQLAEQLVSIWTREGRLAEMIEQFEDAHLHARRLIAQRCLYGVDKNDAAVELAKLSLWLVTMSSTLPFTFVDHALRHGDSLVGLDLEQTASFHWKPKQQVPMFAELLSESLEEALAHREEIMALSHDDSPEAQEEKRRLLDHADHATNRIRLVADVCVGAFFAEPKDKAREKERVHRQDLVERYLAGERELHPTLQGWAEDIRRRHAPFHWWLEFPEVFYDERPDPLVEGEINGAAFMEGFVGNPPFAGKNTVTRSSGPGYLAWQMAIYPEVKGRPNTDLCAYFFRRAGGLLGTHGTLGFLATNTVSQGDTRLMALKHLVAHGGTIYEARRSFAWPGAASITVALAHVAFGRASSVLVDRMLDGVPVAAIDSRLRPHPERPDPAVLASNSDRVYQGGKLVGIGMAIDLQEYDDLVARDPRNADVLRPYLGGDEVNTNVGPPHERYMIEFTNKTLEEARAWPDLLEIIERRVKPARDKDKRGTYRTYWWKPGESAGALYRALEGLSECLVVCIHAKHLIFTLQDTAQFFSNALQVFAMNTMSAFAVLQSRVHEPWVWLLSSTLRDAGIRYTASDCFDTFPFPQRDPSIVVPALESAGGAVYESRARYMVSSDQGLTKVYNALKDPACRDSSVLELRRLKEEMDRAVLDAYGWDIQVPPYCPLTAADQAAVRTFEDDVIARLYALNTKRAKEQAAEAKVATKEKPRRKSPKSIEKTGQRDLYREDG